MAIGSVARLAARPLHRGSAGRPVRGGGGWASPQVMTGWQPPVAMSGPEANVQPMAASEGPTSYYPASASPPASWGQTPAFSSPAYPSGYQASGMPEGTWTSQVAPASAGPEPLPLGPLADALSAIEALPLGALPQALSTISNLGSPLAGGTAPVANPVATAGLPDPQSYFICQLHDSRFNPDAPNTTADCGPTSLAMVLKAFGKAPAEPDAEALVDQVRYTMTGAVNHNALTTPDEILSAGQQYGLSGTKVSSVDQVESAVSRGQLVVLAGNPVAYNTGFSSQQYYPFSGGHFIVVTGVSGDRVTIDDPLSHVGAISISTAQLQQYMAYQGWNEGIAFGA